MLDREGARSLARYKTWADNLTLSAVTALPPGEAARERPTLFKLDLPPRLDQRSLFPGS